MLHTGYEKEYIRYLGIRLLMMNSRTRNRIGVKMRSMPLWVRIYSHTWELGPSLCGALLPLGSSGCEKWNTPGTAIR